MQDSSQNVNAKRIKVDVVERNMKVYLIVREPEAGQTISITLQDLFDKLESEGVKFGINKELLREIVDGQKWGEKFLVAEGKPPTPGDNARLDFYFPTDKSLKPQIKEDGHIDYKEISVVSSVEKDAVLVRKTPAMIGEKGMDVLGNEVNAVYGKDIDLPGGTGVYKDPNDSTVLKSSIEGVVFYNPQSNSILVQQLHTVQGSVDYSTGNVHVKSSIEIKGDVKPDFSVTSPYNIQVRGVVEHATVTCGGTLTVKVGIKGDGKQIVKVAGDIHAGYIQNQIIKCDGSIYASTEIRNSNIECADEVVIVKSNGVILGGKTMATNKVNAASIGNLYYTITEVQVGVKFEFKEKFIEKENALKAVHKQYDDLDKKIIFIEQEPPDGIKGTPIKVLKDQRADYAKEIERLKRELKEIEKDYYNVADPVICVSKTVFPGTIIKIKHAFLEVKEELDHVMFKLDGNDIIYTNLK